jgi:hypothetical protein
MSDRLIGLMKRTDKVFSCRDYMSGIAERHFEMVNFEGYHFRSAQPTKSHELIAPSTISDNVKVGDVAQIIYCGSYFAAWKATPEQQAFFDAIDGECKHASKTVQRRGSMRFVQGAPDDDYHDVLVCNDCFKEWQYEPAVEVYPF